MNRMPCVWPLSVRMPACASANTMRIARQSADTEVKSTSTGSSGER
jgi:hypothetical protein